MSTFQDTIKQMWETRPPRIPSDQGGNAKIAGVCEGIGVRYQIDPTIVRILFVVSTLTLGGGLVAYLLAWMSMPRYGLKFSPLQAISMRVESLDEASAKERSTGWWLLIIFLVLFIPSVSGASGALTSSAVGSIILLLAAWYGLHYKEPLPPAGLLAKQPEQTMPEPVNLSVFSPAEGAPTPPGRVTPPSWDPLGVAPFAWDLPDPTPLDSTPAKKRPRLWLWILIGLGSTLLVVTMVAGAISAVFYLNNPQASNETMAPTSTGELESEYSASIGKYTLDLRGLPALEEDTTVSLTGGIGKLTVYLPSQIPVQLSCHEGLGDSNCVTGRYNGDAQGATLHLNVDSGLGSTHIFSGEEELEEELSENSFKVNVGG